MLGAARHKKADAQRIRFRELEANRAPPLRVRKSERIGRVISIVSWHSSTEARKAGIIGIHTQHELRIFRRRVLVVESGAEALGVPLRGCLPRAPRVQVEEGQVK